MYTFFETPSHLDQAAFEGGEPPFVSIYLQTHRGSQETKQDKLTYKNLVLEAERSLKEHYGKRGYANILKKLEALFESPEESLWRGLKDGLAVLVNNDNMYVCLLDYPVKDRSIVADSFHIKPLIRSFQFSTEYYLLELSKEKFELYLGNARGFDKVELPEDVGNVFEEVFPDLDKDAVYSVGPYGGMDANFHGLQSKSDLQNAEREKYFRYTDKTISGILGEDSQIPVVLVALMQHQSEYRSLSSLKGLLKQGIDARMTSLSDQSILQEATTLVIDAQKEKVSQITAEFTAYHAAGKASADPSEIAAALAQRKVRWLFLDEDVMSPGRFDRETGSISYEGVAHAGVDDLGDDFAQMTYVQGGAVYVLTHNEMPSETGMVAIFRY